MPSFLISSSLNLRGIVIIFAMALFFVVTSAMKSDLTAQEDDCAPLESETIAFISDRDGGQQIYLMNIGEGVAEKITDYDNASLDDLDWSPNGTNLAFVKFVNGWSDIFVVNVESGVIRQFTVSDGSDYSPAWSPDGKLIAYTSVRGGPYDIWIMTANGANIRQMTDDPRWEITVDWIFDGTGIAYVPNSGADLQIWLKGWNDDFAWQTPFLFEDADAVSYPILHSVTDINWSPDGERIALQTDYGAYIINVDGTELRLIEERENAFYGGAPSWSPDSCYIAYTSRVDDNAEIYILDIMGEEEPLRLTTNPARDYSPAWRPASP